MSRLEKRDIKISKSLTNASKEYIEDILKRLVGRSPTLYLGGINWASKGKQLIIVWNEELDGLVIFCPETGEGHIIHTDQVISYSEDILPRFNFVSILVKIGRVDDET